jgi:Tol biopolymer transport system component
VVYRTSNSIRTYQLTWFDTQGRPTSTVGEPGSISNIRLSPDGTRLVYRKDSPNLADQDLWLLDLTRGTNTRFTFGPGIAQLPVWSPDSSEIVFSSNRDGAYNLYRKQANGAKEEELLLRSSENKAAYSWSRDGRFLLYSTSPEITFVRTDLWVLPMQGERIPLSFLRTRFDEGLGVFSPDGRWVAYISNETGRNELYVRPFTASRGPGEATGKWIISKDGGQGLPKWRDDGKELVYVDLTGNLMAVELELGVSVQARTPRILFRIPAGSNALGVAGDLKRFLIPVPVEQKVPQAFTVMLNWTSVLKTK